MLVLELPPVVLRVLALLFGALWGSFFNVAIYRWPREMSVVTPPSHCPACGSPVPWYRNLPILAFALQRGRAACCGAKMTPRYLLVEALGAVLCLALMERFVIAHPTDELGPRLIEGIALFFFVGGLIIATFVDLEHMIIPDEVTLAGAALGLGTVGVRGLDAADAALGAGGGYLLIQVLFVWSYERVFGRRGMGEGDSKLLMFIGAFVGWKGALFAIAAGSMQGVLVAVGGAISGQKVGPGDEHADDQGPFCEEGLIADRCIDAGGEPAALGVEVPPPQAEEEVEEEPLRPRVPFGPFLALGAIEWLFFGEQLLDWYLGMF